MTAQRFVEHLIVRAAVEGLIEAGYAVDVEFANVKNSRDIDAILGAMWNDSRERLYAIKDGKDCGWVYFVIGNGESVLSDYTTNLEAPLAKANKLAADIDGEDGWKTLLALTLADGEKLS